MINLVDFNCNFMEIILTLNILNTLQIVIHSQKNKIQGANYVKK